MASWPEAVARISSGGGPALDVQHARFKIRRGSPIIVMGPSGSGKTRLWSHLTQNSPPDQMSVSTDDGYLVRRNRQAHSIITIPGQFSKTRFFDTDDLFGSETRIEGIIFVASYGYDRVWANQDVVASWLESYDLETLRQRQMRNELDKFSDLCRLILQKRDLALPDSQPKWLLVVVNKLDLFWGSSEDARKYYQVGNDGDFGARAATLMQQLGTAMNFQILPVAALPGDYAFNSSRGSLTQTSFLNSDRCNTSVSCLVETLGELCNG
ncbi:ATP-binding cassette domain-containing protein [Streptomyces sp. NPDC005474]|uniref:ATP-binding cassette domain-containing protein n=1 Tax=Streptomyces sp. NPDC005474 TaxID=3154878 RepID=UPI003454F734